MTTASILKKDKFSLVLLARNNIPEASYRECPVDSHAGACLRQNTLPAGRGLAFGVPNYKFLLFDISAAWYYNVDNYVI
jgi:hypothetical protein